jgi:DNA-binding NarL/FixJ family response regulator
VTERQKQIVRLLAAGGTNRELARRLGVREQTIKNQLSRIYTKLGVRNRLELAVYAARHGLGPDADGRGR